MTQRDPEQVTILHLSDMQFGRNHRFRALDERTETSPDAILETLLTRLTDDLRLLKDSHGIRADLVVMSGDLTEWGLRTEFGQVRRFIDGLAHNLGLPRRCFVLLPGNHDVNRKLCESYFSECEGRETVPAPPYFRKWEPFVDLFREVYASDGDIQFTEEEPWSLFVYQEHRLVVAAFNSTMAESHRAEDHFGQLGERQLRWFAERLRAYRQQGFVVVGAVHHNAVRAAVADDENLRDADDLTRWLGPHIHLLLHGHTHDGQLGRLPGGQPVLSTGSAAVIETARPEETPNQYQIIRLEPGRLWWARRQYHPRQRRWIADTAGSEDGNRWEHEIPLTTWAQQTERAAPVTELAQGAIEQYRRHLLITQGGCPIGENALPPGLRGELSLAALFVPQKLLRELSSDEQKARQEQQRQRVATVDTFGQHNLENPFAAPHEVHEASELLGTMRYPWVLLVGGPGTGKTALTRWLCVRLSTEQPGLVQPVPLRIELRAFDVRYRAAVAAGRSYGFFDYLDDYHRERGFLLDGSLLRELAHRQRVFWLFDGLDEVLDPNQRQHYVGLLIGHIQTPKGHGLITSRALGIAGDAAMLQAAGVTRLDIADFDDGQIEQFVSLWSRAVCSQDGAESERLRQRFLSALQGQARLRELCGNPLLLTLCVMVGRSSLPRYRHELVQHALDLLAGQWESGKWQQGARNSPLHTTLTLPERLRLLRTVADRMGTQIDIEEETLRLIIQSYLHSEAGRDSDTARLAADDLLRGLEERNGVLAYLGDGTYQFQHRMLKDFLRADHLRDQYERQQLSRGDVVAAFSGTGPGVGLGVDLEEVRVFLSGVFGRSHPELVADALGSMVPGAPVGGPWDLDWANSLLHCLAEVPASSDGRLVPFMSRLQGWLMHVLGSSWDVPAAYAYFGSYIRRVEQLCGLDRAGIGTLQLLRQFGARWPQPEVWERWAVDQPSDQYPMTLSWRCALSAIPREMRIRLARQLLARVHSDFLREEIFLEATRPGDIARGELPGPWPRVLTESRPVQLTGSSIGDELRPWMLEEHAVRSHRAREQQSAAGYLTIAVGRGPLPQAMDALYALYAIAPQRPESEGCTPARELLLSVANDAHHAVVRLLAAELIGEKAKTELARLARRARDAQIRQRAVSVLRNLELRRQLRDGLG